jgi:hypothetical protein
MTVLRAAMEVVMFETERFVTDRRTAFAEDSTHKAARDVLERIPIILKHSLHG